jgi:hypothetical protein
MKPWTLALAVTLPFSFTSSVFADNAAPAAVPANTTSAAPAEQAVPAGSVEVLRLVLTSSVENREPGAEVTTAAVGDTVIAWTQIRSGVGETTVTHRWLRESDNLGDVSLPVRGSPWRTWSRKTVGEPGNWKVQVIDAQGMLLKEAAFTVSATPAAAPAATTPQ